MKDGLYRMDCLDGLTALEAGTVDLVFADLPYGRTQNRWDVVIPFERLWPALRRVGKPHAPMVFTAIQPFTSMLVMSNMGDFRYSMVWKKNKSSGAFNANRQPLRAHEDLLIFAQKTPVYAPVMIENAPPSHGATRSSASSNYGQQRHSKYEGGKTWRYPTTILEVPVVNNDDPERLHPTQKPERLVDWFIQTYTKPGDLVLDPTAGSGTTLAAAKRTGRRFIGFETDGEMVAKATKRLERISIAETG